MNILRITTAFCFIILLSGNLFSQEVQPPSDPGNPPELLAQIHCESQMTKDVNMLRDIYHKDVEIYLLPNKLLVKGIDQAILYWTEEFENQGDIGVELMEVISADNGTAFKTKKSDPRLKRSAISVTLIQVKNGKIYRLYL